MDNQEKLQTFISLTENPSIENAFTKLKSVEWDLEKALQLDNASSQIQSNTKQQLHTPSDLLNQSDDITNFRTADPVVREQLIDDNLVNLHEHLSSHDNDTMFFGTQIKTPDYIHELPQFEEVKQNAINENKKYILASDGSILTLRSSLIRTKSTY